MANIYRDGKEYMLTDDELFAAYTEFQQLLDEEKVREFFHGLIADDALEDAASKIRTIMDATDSNFLTAVATWMHMMRIGIYSADEEMPEDEEGLEDDEA